MTASLQPFRTWESYAAERMPPDISLDLMRVRWKAFGDIATAVRVAAHARDPPSDSDEAYCKPGDEPSLHPMSSSSLTEPPISSITVRLDDLDSREANWAHKHIPHAGNGHDVWQDVDDEDDETGDGRKLVRCCNEDRPCAPAPLVIQASTDKGYVTIHDYVVSVHALLQSHRDEIVEQRITTRGDQHGPRDPELYVDLFTSDRIRLDDGRLGGIPFLSLWPRLTSYIDRRLGGQLPTREERFRMTHPPPPKEMMEGVPQGHLQSRRVSGLDRISHIDILALLRPDEEMRNEQRR
ncbi:hypothetical protein B0H66DRAFT_558205 [Apodospora peruviana]|uniref:Uncharacterized protein n=1 Tax=Apodospora peruviana TaxID=516989 RepID=A0AAE0M4D2_9PEZI|nr:hypothetical protein B0H66DRAFT_558205 [Apodospora peruviana]